MFQYSSRTTPVTFDGYGSEFMALNIAVNFYGSAVHPSGASSWGMRLQIALLYPQKSRP